MYTTLMFLDRVYFKNEYFSNKHDLLKTFTSLIKICKKLELTERDNLQIIVYLYIYTIICLAAEFLEVEDNILLKDKEWRQVTNIMYTIIRRLNIRNRHDIPLINSAIERMKYYNFRNNFPQHCNILINVDNQRQLSSSNLNIYKTFNNILYSMRLSL